MQRNTGLQILNASAFEKQVLQSPVPSVVAFVTEWSGACHIMVPVLDQIMDEVKGQVLFFRVDADLNEQLVNDYGIYSIPTFLLFRDGKVNDCITGAVSRKTLFEAIVRLLGDTDQSFPAERG